MHMPDSKILLAIAIVIVLILAYFYFRTGSVPREKVKSGKKSKNNNDLDSIDAIESGKLNAEDLFYEFHNQFINGLEMTEFQQQYDDPDGILYLKLYQLYKLAKDSPGINPARNISVDDYEKILDE